MSLLTAEILTQLDMPSWVGQRTATFKFILINAVKAQRPIELHPLKDPTPTLTHDTTRTIKRQIQGLSFGVDESALINVVQSRILLYMVIGGQSFPLGRYMFADRTGFTFTNGEIINAMLYDEMFIVDQQIETGFSPHGDPETSSTGGGGMYCTRAIEALLRGLPVVVDIASSPFATIGSWTAGTSRGQIVEQIALDGDYFSPWFGNDTKMHFIRTFDPAAVIPTFDLDVGNRVIRGSIIESDDLLTAPNRFIVISNGATTEDGAASPIVGRADVPTTAPHSVVNRGFVIPSVSERQVGTEQQVASIARNLALRQTIFERVELATPPDPRHDAYDVIKWQGEKWLELTWTLPLQEGAAMGHLMRKAYS